MALSAITAQRSAPTEETLARVNQFLDYMWTHPDAKIRYRASIMILNVHSDASYLSAPKASRAVMQEDTSSLVAFHEMPDQSLLMVQSISPAPFSNWLRHRLLKLNLVHCFSMHKMLK
jgi:hypothetical protein